MSASEYRDRYNKCCANLTDNLFRHVTEYRFLHVLFFTPALLAFVNGSLVAQGVVIAETKRSNWQMLVGR